MTPTSGVGGVTKDFAKRGAAGKVFSAVKVMIEEGIVEEGAQEILSNLVTRTFDANTGVFDNLVETMISGVVGSIPLWSWSCPWWEFIRGRYFYNPKG